MKTFSLVEPSCATIWASVETVLNRVPGLKNNINMVLATALPGRMALEYNIGAELMKMAKLLLGVLGIDNDLPGARRLAALGEQSGSVAGASPPPTS